MQTLLCYWLAAIHFPPHKFLSWLAHFNRIDELFLAPIEQLQSLGITTKAIYTLKNPDWKTIEREMTWGLQAERTIITYDDPEYPALLKEIPDPPLVLYLRGNKAALAQMQIGMVGARNASTGGLKNAMQFAGELAQAGFVITSGLALGIDGASHKGALNANGITIAVCGTGLNYVYPSSHKQLAEKLLAQNGALLSEFMTDEKPHAHNFPRRNRIISGMSIGVLVIEAALKSGSLITARLANEFGRDVFAIPGNIHHPLSRGCHHLIRQGAKIVEKVDDILDEFKQLDLAVSRCSRVTTTTSLAPLTLECEQLLNYIDYEMTPMDVIVLRSRLTTSQISSILLILELNGYIETITGGYIRVVANQHRGSTQHV